jgi:hypothetical protein
MMRQRVDTVDVKQHKGRHPSGDGAAGAVTTLVHRLCVDPGLTIVGLTIVAGFGIAAAFHDPGSIDPDRERAWIDGIRFWIAIPFAPFLFPY